MHYRVRGAQGSELWIARCDAGGKSGEKLPRRGALSVELQAQAVVEEQACGLTPAFRRLKVADRLDCVASLRKPPCGCGMQRVELTWLASPQLELQQVGKETVVAKPRTPGIQRDHERVGFFQLMQYPHTAGLAGQNVCQRTTHALEH